MSVSKQINENNLFIEDNNSEKVSEKVNENNNYEKVNENNNYEKVNENNNYEKVNENNNYEKVNEKSKIIFNTNDVLKNKLLMEKLSKEKVPKEQLPHQYLIYLFFLKNPSHRGLLVNWPMGMGKTNLAFLVASTWSNKIIIIAPKKVKVQFDETAKGYPGLEYNFIPLKSNTITKQIDQIVFDKNLLENESVFDDLTLDNTCLIIDEAHLFFNSIANGSQKAIELYEKILNGKNMRILFLSGTPIINSPFELVPCFNMLSGYRLFPENKYQFNTGYKLELDKDGIYSMQHYHDFLTKIYGKVTFASSDGLAEDEFVSVLSKLSTKNKESHFADVTNIVKKIPMTKTQFIEYKIAKEKEQNEANKNAKYNRGADHDTKFGNDKTASTYFIETRKICDYLDQKNCPKIEYIYNDIIKNRKNQVCAVFSNFIQNFLEPLTEYFEKQGKWKDFNKESEDDPNDMNYYFKVTGETTEEQLEMLDNITKSEANKNGHLIKLFLLGPAAGVGLSIMCGRVIYIAEPYFNKSIIDQAAHRIIRYDSHMMLPLKDRKVDVVELIAVYPENIKKEDVEDTTDEHLYKMSERKEMQKEVFIRALKEGSIDCNVNYGKNCLMCRPNNKEIHSSELLTFDCPNCEDMEEKTIKTKSIKYKIGKEIFKYEYSINKETNEVSMYFFNTALNAYNPVPRYDDNYDDVLEMIMKKEKLIK